MVNQDSFEGKMAELAVRQARLESRSALLAALAARVDPQDLAASRRPAATEAAAPAPVTVLAPQKPVATDNFKPAPEGFDLRRAQPSEPSGDDVSENSDPTTPDQRLRAFAAGFDRIEQRQIAALNGLRAPAAAKAERLREAFAEAGLPVDRMVRQAALPEKDGVTPVPMGGPYVPAPERGGDFERAYASLDRSIATMDGLRRALPFAPLRQPLPGLLDVTSTFGYRTDPFLGKPALHSGIDFRGEYGEPVHATAAGRVDRRRAGGRLWQHGRDRPRRGADHPLRPSLAHLRRGWPVGESRRRARRDRLDRTLHRTASALRSARRRRAGRSEPLHQGRKIIERRGFDARYPPKSTLESMGGFHAQFGHHAAAVRLCPDRVDPDAAGRFRAATRAAALSA